MKKKIFFVFSILIIVASAIIFVACDGNDKLLQNVDGASINNNSIYMFVDKDVEYVSLSEKVKCKYNSTWKLYYDRLGQLEIPTKIAAQKWGELNNGDNIFYIVITSSDGKLVSTYELKIHRSYLVVIDYVDTKGKVIESMSTYTGYEYLVTYEPQINGYTFNYWKDFYGEKVTSLIPFSSTTLYADCVENNYTATLDVNDGENLTQTIYSMKYEEDFDFGKPSRTGYTFIGWYVGNTKITDENGISLETWKYAFDTIVIANWQPNKYNLILSSDIEDAGTIVGNKEYSYDSSVTISAIPKNGYSFAGWYDINDRLVSTNRIYTFKMGFDTAYKAKWEYFTLTTLNCDVQAGTVTEYLDSKITTGEAVTIKAINNLGYSFVGWYNGEEILTEEMSYTFVMGKDNLIFTARWEVKEEMLPFVFFSTDNTCTITGIKDNSITKVIVPNYISAISNAAFSNCYNIESITLPFIGAEKEESNYTFLGYIFGASQYKDNGEYIPSTLKEVILTQGNTIGDYAFYKCSSLINIGLPNTLIDIDKSVFWGCSIVSIEIPNSVESIGACAFAFCDNLESIDLPRSVKSIGESAFTGCIKLKSIYIPNSVISVGSYAFEGCNSLKKATIPAVAISTISPKSKLEDVTINGGTKIEMSSFASCSNLVSIFISSSITSIGDFAFSDCINLSKVIFEEESTLTTINSRVFNNCCSLASIEIPLSVLNMGDCVFLSCSKLTICCAGSSAPSGWLSSWNYDKRPVVWNYGGDNGVAENGLVWGLANDGFITIAKYEGIETKVEIPNTINGYNVARIGDYAFANNSSLAEISIANYVINIGDYAFYHCDGLEKVVFVSDSQLTSIGYMAFSGCENLTSIEIPSGVASIASWAFHDCSSLTSIWIPSSVTTIGELAFLGCSNLTIYCEITKKPSGWDYEWNRDKVPVKWGQMLN